MSVTLLVADDHEVILFKTADYHEDYIDFHVAVLIKAARGWEYRVNTARQRPLLQAPFIERLKEVGFCELECYGSLRGEPFDPASAWDLVVVAKR